MMKQSNKKIKVLCAMSGGVDSSVAAALLVRQGYDVTGAFMVNYDGAQITQIVDREDYADSIPRLGGVRGGLAKEAQPCWLPDYRDALRVAAKLRIPLLKFDFTKEYKETVLDYMFKEYKVGRTPNPDVLCNKFIKFGAWLDKTKELGFDYLATGHYARLSRKSIKSKVRNNIQLLQSKDKNKDQTYFLHQLSQEQLRHALFPIGGYLKSEVRSLARRFDLPTAKKEESMGICFIGEVPMKEFLETRIKSKIGDIVLSPSAREGVGGEGEAVVGQHDGLAFYTIGQRVGVSPPLLSKEGTGGGLPSFADVQHDGSYQINGRSRSERDPRPPSGQTPPASPDGGQGGLKLRRSGLVRGGDDTRPLYVVAKNLKTNEFVVGYDDDPLLYKKEVEVSEVNWISGQPSKFPLKCEVRLRHRQPLQRVVVTVNSPLGRGRGGLAKVAVKFATPQRAVTSGQFAVFYKKGECLGGGEIK